MAAQFVSSLVSKQTRRALLEYLMREGTIVVREDCKLAAHDETGLQNLHVLLLMRSLASKKLVTKEYNWRYRYYVLTTEGVEYIRQELRLPSGPMPATYAMKARVPRTDRAPRGDRSERPPRTGGPRRFEPRQPAAQVSAF